ncbi:MAG: hypothetical protein M3083_06110 [Actinomycetota bacterium]|nr:hypothetical protein [Actinomycetota bacterium]
MVVDGVKDGTVGAGLLAGATVDVVDVVPTEVGADFGEGLLLQAVNAATRTTPASDRRAIVRRPDRTTFVKRLVISGP